MILKGAQRGGGRGLARHLLNKKENDHVEVHEIRGLAAETLAPAFLEIEAVSKGTKATKPLFAVIFNPPQEANVSLEEFETAFADVEQKLGLENQPRAVVFHEKQGRRHAHVVWSRIDTDQMKAIPMSHFKRKLQDVSRDLYIQHGWDMPKGLKDRNNRDPLNFDLPTWQQAKRLKEDPRDLKKIIHEALNASDGVNTFQKSLEAQGMMLARGDKRGFVVIHHTGEVMSLNRWSGFKSKEIKARLGTPDGLPAVEIAQLKMQGRMTSTLTKTLLNIRKKQKQERAPLVGELQKMKDSQKEPRKILKQAQQKRWAREELTRAKRLRKGIMGLWDRVTGKRGRVSRQNHQEAQEALKRDKSQRQDLINRQMKERRELQEKFKKITEKQKQEINRFRYDMGFQMKMAKAKEKAEGREKAEKLKDVWKEQNKDPQKDKDKGQGRERTRNRGPGRGPKMD